MKVKELLAALAEASPEAEVILQKDAEGNDYSPLEGVDGNAIYVPTNTWTGIVYSLKWTASDADMTEAEWVKTKTNPRCVVLFPVN